MKKKQKYYYGSQVEFLNSKNKELQIIDDLVNKYIEIYHVDEWEYHYKKGQKTERRIWFDTTKQPCHVMYCLAKDALVYMS